MQKFLRILLSITLVATIIFVPLVPTKVKAADAGMDVAVLEAMYSAKTYYHETLWIGNSIMKTGAANVGDYVDVQAAPVIIAGSTYVPMSFVMENLVPAEMAKTAVIWDAKTKKATFIRGTHKVEVWIGKSTILVDGISLSLAIPAFITGGRTMLPLRTISEGIGALVFWDATDGAGRIDIFATIVGGKVPNIYTITASAGAGGKIDPVGSVGVNEGTDKIFTITANSGYSAKTILVDGIAVGTGPSYTFKNVTTEHIISATFLELPPVVIPVIPSGERDRAPVIISPVIPSLTNYTVTFVDWDGTILSTSEVNAGATAQAPGAPTRDGYTFAGWDRTLTDIMAATTITATYTVLALINYPVTFVDWDGTILSTLSVNAGETAPAPSVPTRDGYTFAGWDQGLTNITAATTITATYTIPSLTNYTVTFVDWDGTILSTSEVNAGATAPAPGAPTRTGYTFVGWDRALTDIMAATTITATYSNNSYTLIYTAGVNGYISGPSPQTVNYGADGSEVTAGAELGYHFVNWSDASTQNPRTDLNVIIDINITASFGIDIPNTYILTYNAGANGYISGPSPQTVNAGTAGSEVTAEPAFGYHFVSWSDLSTTNPRTDTNVTADISVAATFAINTFTLTYNTGANGSISGISPQTVNYGKDGIEVTAVADLGYHFTSWSDGGLTAVRTDFNIAGDLTVTANFAVDTFTLTYTAGANGSILGTLSQIVNVGADGTLVTAVPELGYRFVNWSDVSTQNPRTDTNLTADLLVTANFVINTFTLAYNAGANGSISGTTPQIVNYGADGTEVIAVPDSGYHFTSWSDGELMASRTDLKATEGITVTASFEIDTFTLIYNVGSNGSILGTSLQSVGYGEDGTEVTALANLGYHFTSWSDGDLTAARTDTNVKTNINVTASFELNTFALTYKVEAHGSISGTSPQTVNYGLDGAEVTAVAEGGYHFVSWSDNVMTAARTDIKVTADISVTAAFAINTFTLTYNAGDNGTITGASSQTVNYGLDGIEVTAVPELGYHFVNWSDDVLTAKRTDTNVTADISVTATFAIDTFTLTYTAGTNGAILGTSPQPVDYGGSGTEVTAVPALSYHFFSWSDLSVTNPRTDTKVTANISVTATFAINTFTMTYTAGTNGAILGTSPQPVDYGGSGTEITAVPALGYHFVSWSDLSTTNPRTDLNVTADVTVSAAFEINTFTLTYNAGAKGTITGTSPQTVNYGASGSEVTAVPNTGYAFGAWSDGITTGTRTDTNVMASGTVTANFIINQYTVTFNENGGDTEASPLSRTADYNTAVTLPTAPTRNGYTFASWNTGGGGGGTTFDATTPVAANFTVYAQWTIKQYTLTYTAGANGTKTGASPQTVNYDADGTLVTAVPNANYHFVQWSDGVLTAARTDTNVAGNITVTADFTIDTFTLNYTAGANGSISGVSPQTVNYGTNGKAVTPVPSTNYHFVDWSDTNTANPRIDTGVTANITVTANFAINTFTATFENWDSTVLGTSTVPYDMAATAPSNPTRTGYTFTGWDTSFTNMVANITVTANFAFNTYTITASAGSNGTVTPAGVTTKNYGATQAYAITPAMGYYIATVTVDGEAVAATSPYTFTGISANHTISATFANNTYTLTYIADVGGTLSGATSQIVNYNSNGTAVTANPSTGYHFVNWSDAVITTTRTDTNITANQTVTANFAINQYTVTFKNWDGATLSTPSVNYGGTAPAPSDPIRLGYTFTGWDRVLTNITAATTITADYTINNYTVTFDKNGGTTEANPTTRTTSYNTTVVLPVNPTRGTSGMWWVTSWNTLANGTGTTFTGATPVVANITVYAQWRNGL